MRALTELKIAPEFRDKIPPLTDAEFEQLRENILADGEVYEPITVWNGTIIDGHNRWKVIQEHPEIPYRVKEMDFPDKWAAFEWMYRKQLGRRNLTDEQKTYMIGKMYEARKKTAGGQSGNDNAAKRSPQNGDFVKSRSKTAQTIANELGIGKNTVERSEKFAHGVDILKSIEPKAADKVLTGETKVAKIAIQGIEKQTPKQQKEVAKAILENKPLPSLKEPASPLKPQVQVQVPSAHYNGGGSAGYRKDREEIAAIVADMYDPTTIPEYTVEDMVDEIQSNGEQYVNLIKNVLSDRNAVLSNDTRPVIAKAIESVIQEMRKVVESVAVSERP